MSDHAPLLTTSELETYINQAARRVGELLRSTSEYEAYLSALNAVNNHPDVQKIAVQIRSHQNALRWFQGDIDEHEASLARLEAELETLPVVQGYRQAERILMEIFTEVDAIISQAAGVAFAVNARRSGCGCGG